MNFENQYLKYEEYLSFGGKIDEMPFNVLEFKARQIIDEETLGRIKNLSTQNENVKLCVYELVNELNSQEKVNKNISSESIDGYSVSYNQSNDIKSNDENLVDIVFKYLINCRLDNGTPYLYKGV